MVPWLACEAYWYNFPDVPRLYLVCLSVLCFSDISSASGMFVDGQASGVIFAMVHGRLQRDLVP